MVEEMGDCNKVNLTRVERVGHIRLMPLVGQLEEEGEFMEGSSTFKWIPALVSPCKVAKEKKKVMMPTLSQVLVQ